MSISIPHPQDMSHALPPTHADHPPPGPLRVGYVPEHFSTPLHILQHKILPLMKPSPLIIELVPFPSGTGAMISSLSTHSIDVAVGLTEGWIAGLAQGKQFYRLIGSYVESPLRWAISTGLGRQSEFLDSQGRLQLKGKKLGVSRIGSGSYVMGYVLAERAGWLDTSNTSNKPFDFVVLNDFAGLRAGVNSRTADAFMWEYYTSKKYYTTTPELAHIGELPTPWPSWHIVCQSTLLPSSMDGDLPGPPGPPTSHPLNPDPRVSLFLIYLNSAIEYFDQHPKEVVDFIEGSQDMHYSREDAEAWLKEVRFVKDTRKVDMEVVRGCVDVLKKAGVVPAVDGAQSGVKTNEMFVPVTW